MWVAVKCQTCCNEFSNVVRGPFRDEEECLAWIDAEKLPLESGEEWISCEVKNGYASTATTH